MNYNCFYDVTLIVLRDGVLRSRGVNFCEKLREKKIWALMSGHGFKLQTLFVWPWPNTVISCLNIPRGNWTVFGFKTWKSFIVSHFKLWTLILAHTWSCLGCLDNFASLDQQSSHQIYILVLSGLFGFFIFIFKT
jgi:hypothetical protein